jgi:hypothetical protein
MYKLAHTLVSDKMDIEEKTRFFAEDLNGKDRALVRAVQEQYQHGVDMTTEFKCGACEEVVPTIVPFRLEMLLPDGAVVRSTMGTQLPNDVLAARSNPFGYTEPANKEPELVPQQVSKPKEEGSGGNGKGV